MRWADMDLLGHVNNVVYVDYLQEARVDMLRTHGPAAHTGELAEGVVVVRHEVHYEAPLVFDFRSVSIESWVTEIRVASFTMAYEIFHEDPDVEGGRRVYLRATTVLTPYVFATERPRRLSTDERETLAVFLEPGEPTRRAAVGPARREKVGHYPVQVRFSDVDVYGHVNNVRYFEYYMEARILYTARLWRETAEERGRVAMVVAQTDVEYQRPILFRAGGLRLLVVDLPRGPPLDGRRVRDLRRGRRALPRAGGDGVLRPGHLAPRRAAGRAARAPGPRPRRLSLTPAC